MPGEGPWGPHWGPRGMGPHGGGPWGAQGGPRGMGLKDPRASRTQGPLGYPGEIRGGGGAVRPSAYN